MNMNQRNPAIKRILADVKELQRHPSYRYFAAPLEDDMFEWHFTIRGPDDTPFQGGIYHGRILLPAEYPFKPPNIVFLTVILLALLFLFSSLIFSAPYQKNGRFEVGTKICLSISAYHEETWQPAWGGKLLLIICY
jgi:ubiquitin-conjugating enzyme E2 J1